MKPTAEPVGPKRFRFDRRDVFAGFTVALLLVPQSVAYAQLAGLPAARGLYAAAFPPLASARFGSSPYLQTGPTAITALLTFGALSPLAPIASAKYIKLALLLALLVGAIRLAIGWMHAGMLAYLMSDPVLIGFVPAAGILIVSSQIPVAVGASGGGDNVLLQAARALGDPASWHAEAFVLALALIAVVALGSRIHRLFPGVLVAVGLALAYSELTEFDGPVVGSIGAGLPHLTTSLPLAEVEQLMLPAIVIALIGFVEASSIARTYATKDRAMWDPNREFVGQGVANVAAGLFGGFPVGASFSRSSLNRLAGARTTASGFFAGLFVLAALPLGFVLASLPRSALAAIVIAAVFPLVRLTEVRNVMRVSWWQFAVTATAFALTLILAPRIEWALLAAIALSIVVHLVRELRIQIDGWRVCDELHVRPLGVLWFGSAPVLEDEVVRLIGLNPDARKLVVHLSGLGRIDLTGALVLQRLAQTARAAGLEVRLGSAQPASRPLLSRVFNVPRAE